MNSVKSPSLLERIQTPRDLKLLNVSQLIELADELRHFMLHALNLSGGHFSANLGTVELAIALHYVFDTPHDKLIWDVGHQAYPHKILTQRRDAMHTIRQANGLAPFPARDESIYDAFGVGHSSTSLSAALGMSIAKHYQNDPQHVVAVIGDGAMTAGLAYEALSHAGQLQANAKVILNDNDMSISYHDSCVISQEFFSALKFDYEGPIDGHDLSLLIVTLQKWKAKKGPQLLHVITKKGKGYAPAEQDPVGYHAVTPGYLTAANTVKKSLTYSQVFGEWVCAMAAEDKRLMAITPAMSEGSGLTGFQKQFSTRFFDVGIAEQHSVTFAAGLACEGLKPVVAIYATFLQRAYDQLIHDVAIQNLPVLFAVDRAGIVGGDGATHQGAFDLSFVRCIPNLIIMTPANEQQCWDMLTTAYQHNGPTVVRYPRGAGVGMPLNKAFTELPIGKAEVQRQGKGILILAWGSLLQEAKIVAETLNATLVDMRFVKPLDEALIAELVPQHTLLVTLEENVVSGGVGSAVGEYLHKINYYLPHLAIGLPDHFVEHGDPRELHARYGLDANSIIKKIRCFQKNS